MNEQLNMPVLQYFDCTRAKELIDGLSRLTTFSEVSVWDRDSGAEISRIESHLKRHDELLRQLKTLESAAKREHDSKPFFKRIFSSPAHLEGIEAARTEIEREREELPKLADGLQSGIDQTPNSPEEQKEILQHLRFRKKELTQEKRAVNEDMRLIRTEARQQSAEVAQ